MAKRTAKERKEYRVIWRRDGLNKKVKRYATAYGAERMLTFLLSPEPWRLMAEHKRKSPDDLFCCSGYECGCGGVTVRAHFDEFRKDIPTLIYARVESRPIGEWSSPAPATEGE